MKKKYQIALVVIGCLIALIGLSYAYFMVNSNTVGNTGSTTVKTVTIEDVGFNIEGLLEFNDLDIYPGHKNISKIKVTAFGNNDTINYKLVWEGINTLNTPLKYYVYKASTNEEATITCQKETEQIGATKKYYETCTNNNFDNLGEIVETGEINKTDEKKEFILKTNEVIKGTEEGRVIYYYIVLEYPNLEESQNIDMGGKFEGIVTVKKEEDVTSDITIKKIYQQTDNGYEEINRMPENGYELNSEKSTCTNNAIPKLKNNNILITNLTTSGTECNIYLDKDTTKPTISSVTTTVTKTEINVTVTASDNMGVTEYWYQLNSNAPVKGTGNTYKFTGLTAGTTYSIKVYVKDASGNQSDTTTESVTTDKPTGSEIILNNITVNSGTPNFANAATTNEGVYKVSDPVYGGYSYYWRGAVTNNYVKFAGKCWRIVRINGDGSVRLIYDGTTCHANGTDTTDSIAVARTAYNPSYNQSNYVGWTYTGTSQRTLSGTSSNAKIQLESWYNSNIGNNTTYASKIADGKYCNDRNVQSGSTWAINGSTFYYAAYTRRQNNSPSLACNLGDVYTLKVGLITADEVEFAGGKNANNSSYYLYNGQYYWTTSPVEWNGSYSYAYVFLVDAYGNLTSDGVNGTTPGLRPVINLKADTLFAAGGTGTQSNPYVVSD